MSTLYSQILTQTERAMASGALQPIVTERMDLLQAGARFVVHTLAAQNPKRRALLRQRQESASGRPGDPFLPPYDPDLFVADLSATHVCLLNKFPVFAHHFLIVTRAYVDQEDLLTLADFQALWACLAQVDGLAFYNGGGVAGASQPHKHLQLVPFQANPGLIPLEARLAGRPGLPMRHGFARLDPRLAHRPDLAAHAAFGHYLRLLRHVGLGRRLGQSAQAGPYNLLLTRRWILLIPRRLGSVAGVEVNALGFAGSLLVRTPEQMAWLRRRTPLLLLRAVVHGEAARGGK